MQMKDGSGGLHLFSRNVPSVGPTVTHDRKITFAVILLFDVHKNAQLFAFEAGKAANVHKEACHGFETKFLRRVENRLRVKPTEKCGWLLGWLFRLSG